MITFVVCDDNKEMSEKVSKLVTKIMMPLKDEYIVNIFNDYNKKFYNLIKHDGNKIYILDIEMPQASGLDIARKIRENDWESVIIILTAHGELQHEAFKNRLMLLDFISKFSNYEKTLKNSLKVALKIVNRKKVLEFTSNYIKYRLNLDDIIFLERDTNERKVIIQTIDKKYVVSKSLSDLKNKLGVQFYQTHRAMIINIDYIRTIDYVNRVITFNNKMTTDLLSKDNMKGLKENV